MYISVRQELAGITTDVHVDGESCEYEQSELGVHHRTGFPALTAGQD